MISSSISDLFMWASAVHTASFIILYDSVTFIFRAVTHSWLLVRQSTRLVSWQVVQTDGCVKICLESHTSSKVWAEHRPASLGLQNLVSKHALQCFKTKIKTFNRCTKLIQTDLVRFSYTNVEILVSSLHELMLLTTLSSSRQLLLSDFMTVWKK